MIPTFSHDDGNDEFSPDLHADSLMAQQVPPAHLKPQGAVRSAVKTTQIIRRGRPRIPSWLEADSSLHPEAVYIEADRFCHQNILLAIRRRTIHTALRLVVTDPVRGQAGDADLFVLRVTPVIRTPFHRNSRAADSSFWPTSATSSSEAADITDVPYFYRRKQRAIVTRHS